MTSSLIIDGVDIRHLRLENLVQLAEQSKPFYDWVEEIFQRTLMLDSPLTSMIMQATFEQIHQSISACYRADNLDRPILFDGISRSYPHAKACYYFFGWLVRDAPQQRLAPLINDIVHHHKQPKIDVEIEVLTSLIMGYRDLLSDFSWQTLREVIIDRLEGSRRSLGGHEAETLVRGVIAQSLQNYFDRHHDYGLYKEVRLGAQQVTIGHDTYDIIIQMRDTVSNEERQIIVPVKTRETSGGGHAHLFTRDLVSSIQSLKVHQPFTIILIVLIAQNWSVREQAVLEALTRGTIVMDKLPTSLDDVPEAVKIQFDSFIADSLTTAITD